MQRLRLFIRTPSRGGLLAVYLAYALAIQATMASVGFAMSAGATPDRTGLALCGALAHRSAPTPGDRQTPAPQCPFCYVAAQSGGHAATSGEVPAVPAYTGLVIATIARRVGDAVFVPQFRHRTGEPRAPPAASV